MRSLFRKLLFSIALLSSGAAATAQTISSVSPASGNVGLPITINGSSFGTSQGSSTVSFNGTAGVPTSWGAGSITVPVPSGASTGPLVVTVGGVASNQFSFTVVPTPNVTGISPTTAAPGSQITINGSLFGATQGSSNLYLNGVLAQPTSWSDTQIVATVPDDAQGYGPVSVIVGGVTGLGPQFQAQLTAQVTDSLGNVSTYTMQAIGSQWRMTAAQGSGCSSCTARGTIQNSYDGATGNVQYFTDARGKVTQYAYDTNGNTTEVSTPIAATQYTYNSFGEVLTATDPYNHTTTNTYDAKGNLLTITLPAPASGVAASVITFTYDSAGNLLTIKDPLGNVTTLTHYATGLINTIKDAQGNLTTYAYDAHGNRTSVTDANSQTTTFTYDAGDRLTKITHPDSTTTQFGYDYRGRRISVTDQNGKVTAYAYDDADRLTSVTDAATNVTAYGYDTESNLTSITDANSHTTSFAYDAFGRVTKTMFPSSASETYGYDANNNLTSKTDRKGQTITYAYDAVNRLTSKTYPDNTTVNYTYDLDNRLTQVTDPTGTYQFTFDNMGRLTGTTTSYSFLTSRSFTTSYTYDAASNRTGFTDPESGSTAYAYDTLNRLQTLTPPTAFVASGNFGFGYDALSRRTQLTRPNGVTTNYAYDTLSRLTSVLHQLSGSTIDGTTYTVDNAGNRTSKTDQRLGVTTNYSYDAIYQLTQATQAGSATESYTYDAVGNRLSSLGASPYSYNVSNELTSTPTATYTYDSNGNTASKTDSTGTTTYTWDFENRLTSATLPASSGTVNFKYDSFGRRVYKSSSIATSIFAYDGDNLIEEANSSGTVAARYSQGQNIDEPLAMLRSATTSFYQADGLGSATSLSNTAGALAQTYGYDSFGKQTSSSGSLTNTFQFTAREFDPEISLYYYRARYHDAVTGRFTREDPVRFAAGKNFYPYVANNPTGRKDPRGLKQLTLGGGLGLGALLTIGYNGGQFNFGLYSGEGVGGLVSYDPTDSGCRKSGAFGGVRTESGVGLGEYASVSTAINLDNEGGIEGEINVNANFPGTGGGVTWNPAKPTEPPHGVLGAGAGVFAGIGFMFYSPTRCPCDAE